jgi:molecular chaperone GrpE
MDGYTTDEPEVEPREEAEPDRATMTRALRELEAARGRVERDARRVHDETRMKLVKELFPVLDNLDRAIHMERRRAGDPLLDAVRLLRAQLDGVLRGYGVERIDAIGRPFDPNVHEAVSITAVQDPARHATVVDQVEAGYRFGDRLLRPAKVVVGRAVD